MTIVLAFLSAMVYGVADYAGGRASRSAPSPVVAFVGQLASLLVVAVALVVASTDVPDASTLLWGAGGGVSGALGLCAFYFALANGAMTVVAPLTAVVGAVLPVGVGVATGERPQPIAFAGIACAVLAVALVSGALHGRDRPTSAVVVAAAGLAGVGFGGLFVCFDRAADDAGLWPLLTARAASVPLLAILVLATRRRAGRAARRTPTSLRARSRGRATTLTACVAGVLDMVANLLYLLATRGGLLSLVAVVGSLYPVSTVALAFAVDGERVERPQVVGILAAAAALVMVTLGRG